MADETPPPPPARTAFLLGLGGALVPCVAAVGEWLAFAVQPRGPEVSPAQRVWTRRLLALCVVDTLLALLVAGVLAKSGVEGLSAPGAQAPLRAAPTGRAVVGIQVESVPEGGGARVASVSAGSPAERAGLAEGDVVVRCDGEPMPTREALMACITARTPGATVSLGVRRAGAESALTLETQGAPALPAGTLAEPRWEPLAGAALLVLLAAAGWARARARETVGAVAVLGLAFLAVPPLQLVLSERLPRPWHLLPLALTGLSLLVGAWLVRRVTGSTAPSPWSAAPGWERFLPLALWVHFTGLVRVGVLLSMTLLLLGRTDALVPTPIEGVVASEVRGAVATALFLLVAVVLAPLAEEAFFRGVVLEGLLRWMRPWLAVASTAVVFALMHGGYGLRGLLIFFIGCVLGWARLHSGGLRVPVLVHGAQNLFAAVLMLLMARG